MPVPATYLQSCSMRLKDVTNVSKMILSRFPQIELTVNPHRETYPPLLAQKIPKEEVLVTFEIPREGIYMPSFFSELINTLNQESPMMPQRENKG